MNRCVDCFVSIIMLFYYHSVYNLVFKDQYLLIGSVLEPFSFALCLFISSTLVCGILLVEPMVVLD